MVVVLVNMTLFAISVGKASSLQMIFSFSFAFIPTPLPPCAGLFQPPDEVVRALPISSHMVKREVRQVLFKGHSGL